MRGTSPLHAGSSGDVADALSLKGRSPKWLPPRGALQYHHMPGHAPGQVWINLCPQALKSSARAIYGL